MAFRWAVEYNGCGRLCASPERNLLAAGVSTSESARRWRRRLASAGLALLAWSGTLFGQDLQRPRSVLMLFSIRSTAPAVAEMESTFRRTRRERVGLACRLLRRVPGPPGSNGRPVDSQLTDLLSKKYAGRQVRPCGGATGRGARLSAAESRGAVPRRTGGVLRHRPFGVRASPAVRGRHGRAVLRRRRTHGRRRMELVPAPSWWSSSAARRRRTERTRRSSATRKGQGPSGRGSSACRVAPRRATEAPGGAAGRQRRVLRQLPRRRPGRSMVAADVVRLVARASNAPTFGAAEAWLGRGIVGGDLIRYGPQAQRAAELAARAAQGRAGRVGPAGRRADRAR